MCQLIPTEDFGPFGLQRFLVIETQFLKILKVTVQAPQFINSDLKTTLLKTLQLI